MINKTQKDFNFSLFIDVKKVAELLDHKLSYIKSSLCKISIENSPEIRLTMSFGAVIGTELVSNLIEKTDKALYESKKTRDTYTIIDTI
ncbi:MAG: hypothetical protein K5870_11415 [Lachnospiraceae bacterium]|nr:hypothetical protein [Lachnospiraceae bacterium]